VRRVLRHVDQLAQQPNSGSRPPELGRSRFRQIVELPCRVFYRPDRDAVYILHVMRSERVLKPTQLRERTKRPRT